MTETSRQSRRHGEFVELARVKEIIPVQRPVFGESLDLKLHSDPSLSASTRWRAKPRHRTRAGKQACKSL